MAQQRQQQHYIIINHSFMDTIGYLDAHGFYKANPFFAQVLTFFSRVDTGVYRIVGFIWFSHVKEQVNSGLVPGPLSTSSKLQFHTYVNVQVLGLHLQKTWQGQTHS